MKNDVIINGIIYREVWKRDVQKDLEIAKKYGQKDFANSLERLLFYGRIKLEIDGKIVEYVMKDESRF